MSTMVAKTLKSRTLGTLKYDKEFNWWTTRFAFAKGLQVEIAINNVEDMPGALASVEKKIGKMQKDEERFRHFAAKKLLKLANEWAEGETVTEKDFVGRMQLESVSFYDDLSAGLYYNDGDLFWGHTITVDLDKNGKCTRAEFQG